MTRAEPHVLTPGAAPPPTLPRPASPRGRRSLHGALQGLRKGPGQLRG